jgi:hypothetical protein
LNEIQQPRPAFTEAFPSDPRLDALVEAFGRGDYARVRTEGARLALEAEDERVRAAARVLVERTRPDRMIIILLAVASFLVIALSVWWTVHGKAP